MWTFFSYIHLVRRSVWMKLLKRFGIEMFQLEIVLSHNSKQQHTFTQWDQHPVFPIDFFSTFSLGIRKMYAWKANTGKADAKKSTETNTITTPIADKTIQRNFSDSVDNSNLYGNSWVCVECGIEHSRL